MEMNINVYDFVNEDEIKTAILKTIGASVARQYSGSESNLNRLITNLSYQYVFEMINRQYNGELEKILKEKIVKVIDNLTEYSVFKRKDAWEKEESVAYKVLQEEMANARPLIKTRVEKVISEYPLHELTREYIGQTISECIMDKLFDNDKGKTLESDR